MLLAVNLENIAIMWIAIEGSTLSAALLIGFDRSKAALEAGWKYIILSSVGIALALFGTILVYYSSEHVLGVSSEALRWSQLYRVAEGLDPGAIKVAFIFALIGYGTKAGVAPMHTWLPDAHAEAPTPVSAMLSANMLTVAVYAILRFKAVTDRTVGPEFAGKLIIGLACCRSPSRRSSFWSSETTNGCSPTPASSTSGSRCWDSASAASGFLRARGI